MMAGIVPQKEKNSDQVEHIFGSEHMSGLLDFIYWIITMKRHKCTLFMQLQPNNATPTSKHETPVHFHHHQHRKRVFDLHWLANMQIQR